MRQLFFGTFTVVALFSGLLGGCAGSTEAQVASADVKLPKAGVVFGEFRAVTNPKSGTMTIERIGDGEQYGPTYGDQSLSGLNLDQYGGGASPPSSIVDLISTNCVDNYPGQPTFQCDVELRQFYPRSFANVFAEIATITSGDSNPASDYAATNGDTDGADFGISNANGYWEYTASGAPTGVLTQSPFNTGTRTWVFGNPDDVGATYTFAVVASVGFPDYTFGFQNLGYTDVCSGGTTITTTSKPNITMPFDFTLFNTNSSRVNIAYNGQVTFSTTTLTATHTPIALPSTSAPHPVFFGFWDYLVYGTGGKMCYQTLGTAPNRQFAVEWRDMNFGNAPGNSPASNLDFVAYFYEGTGEIDTFYNSMAGGTGNCPERQGGSQATVGIQDETGTISTSEYEVCDYDTGSGWSYLPNPI